MNVFNTFEELACDTKAKLMSFFDYAPKTISRIESILELIGKEMDSNRVAFSLPLANRWLDRFIRGNGYSHGTFLRYRRVILLLDANFNGDLKEWPYFPIKRQAQPQSRTYNMWVEMFHGYLSTSGYAEKSIYVKISFARYFLCWLEERKVYSADMISASLVSEYCTSQHFEDRTPEGISSEIISLRQFLCYLEGQSLISENIHMACLSRCNDQRRITSIYSDEQVKTLLADYEHLPTNIRNKAVYLLAVKCGLRSCDIMNLKFKDVDFENKTIRIVQQKTKVVVEVPFDAEVSNALVDYILNGRRPCDLDNIFVTVNGPVRRLTHNTSFRTSVRFKCSGDENAPAHDGIHILRRTYASNLLRSGVAVSMIASVLGHSSLSVVDRYLSVDLERMKKCALPIDRIPYDGRLF